MKAKRDIRRKDRILEPDDARTLLENGEYGFLAMVNADGGGYGLPMSYACSDSCIYFHCAPAGHKLDNIAANNRVTFTVVGKTQVIPGQFTTAYQSVMAFGTIDRNLHESERAEALWLLVEKYSPQHKEAAKKYIEASFNRTEILRMNIEHITAKTKRIFPAGE